MVPTPMRWLSVAALLGVAAALPAGQSPAPEKTSPAAPAAPAATPPPPSGLEPLKLPDDAVLVIVEKAADALRMVPGAVLLKPEKYQEMLDDLDRLRGRARSEKAVAPSKCQLKGKTEGGVLTLQAQFEFRTDRPQTVVRLGCPQARAVEVTLDDGRKPLLRYDPSDGFSAAVEKPGEHVLTLDLALPLSAKGAGRGVELDLPRAAVTNLELELPPGSRDLRLDGKPLNDPLLEFKANVLKGPLPGSADRLDLAWSGPSAGPGVLTVRGTIRVRVDERQTVTEAELALKREGGEADAWKVLVPPGAEVKLPPGEEGRLAGVDVDDKAYGPFASLRTLRLKTPADAVKVLVTARGPQPRPGAPAPIGPFAAPGATRQSGAVFVSSSAPGLRLDFQRRGDVARRAARPEEAQNDPTLVAAFEYWSVPATEKPGSATGPGSLSLVDVEAEAVRGLVEARVSHALTLGRDRSGARRWRLKTKVEAAPVRSGVELVKVALPPGFRYAPDAGSADPAVRSVERDERTNELSFRLAGAESKPFTLNVEGDYSDTAPGAGQASLALPRPLETRDLGGQVTLAVPDEVELVPGAAGPGLDLTAQDPQSQAWRSASFPERVEATWRPYRPEVQSSAEADVTLTAGEGQVRQTLRLRFPRAAPDQIALHVPPAVASRLRVVRGGSLNPREPFGPSVRLVDVRSPGEAPAGRDVTLVVEYGFVRGDAREPGAALEVPLVHPESAARGETKVRVWAEPGAAPLAPGGAWTELPVEEVHGQDRLPALVLRAQRPDVPLVLPLAAPEGPAVTVLTERALVRAAVTEGGGQSYRAGFALARLASRHLDVELPAPAAGLNPRFALDGKQVTWDAVDDAGRRAPAGRVARLRLAPQLVKRGSVLEVACDLPPGRAATGLVQTTLTPPVLRGDPGRVPTRWSVRLPSGWVVLGPDGGPGQDRVWVRRGWLFVPRPAVTEADLERWLTGREGATAGVPRADEAAAPSLSCWRDRPEPLRLTHVPQQGWLLVCSLWVLGAGLSLFALARRRTAAWPLPAAAALGAGLTAAALLWPAAAAAAAFGCEPGVAVLAVAAPFLWAQHERLRRRAAFPPSFSRSRGPSPSSPQRAVSVRGAEPSTVDVPRPDGVPRPAPELPRLEGSGSGRGAREPQAPGSPGA